VPRWVLEQHRAVYAMDASDKFVEISEMLVLHDAAGYAPLGVKAPRSWA
jgi:hypothetical protein